MLEYFNISCVVSNLSCRQSLHTAQFFSVELLLIIDIVATILPQVKHFTCFYVFFFGTTTFVCQGLPVLTSEVSLAFSDLLVTNSRIVSPTYGGMVYSGLEPMAGMLLRRTT